MAFTMVAVVLNHLDSFGESPRGDSQGTLYQLLICFSLVTLVHFRRCNL